jgi:hypothetical protein
VYQSYAANTSIDLYKAGTMATEQFITKLADDLDLDATNTTIRSQIKDAWNASCTITPQVIESLTNLNTLQSELGFELVAISGTNPLHFAYITEQLSAAELDLELINSLSFEQHSLSYLDLAKQAITSNKRRAIRFKLCIICSLTN